MTTSTFTLPPVQQAERVQIVDILRGFALFGILFVNMTIFSRPMQTIVLPNDPSLPSHDRTALWLIYAFGEGKFYSLFSMLFGLGLTLLMVRVEGRGGRFVPLYLRRLIVLLGIGLVHAFLIWAGDILILYALLGFLLLLFRKAKPRTLLIWLGILLALPILFNLAVTSLVALGQTIPEAAAQIDQAFAEAERGFQTDLARAYQGYISRNYLKVTEQRAYDYWTMGLSSFWFLGFSVFAMFLLGVYFGKISLFQYLEANRRFFQRMALVGLTLGLGSNLLYATLIMSLSRVYQSWLLLLANTAHTLGAPLLMLGYVSIFCLMALNPPWGKWISILAPVGQMSLTNYLLQSIICTLIFYGYGLGLFGKVGYALGIGLTIVIYLLQIPLSQWWLKRFQYGPAEWLWRSLTYGKRQPMNKLIQS